jgi:hypothetical protein
MKSLFCLLTGLTLISLSATAVASTPVDLKLITVRFQGDPFPGEYTATLNYNGSRIANNLEPGNTYTISPSSPQAPLIIFVGPSDNTEVVCTLNGVSTYTLVPGENYLLTGQANTGPKEYGCTVQPIVLK